MIDILCRCDFCVGVTLSNTFYNNYKVTSNSFS